MPTLFDEGRNAIVFDVTPKVAFDKYEIGKEEEVYIWVMVCGRLAIFNASVMGEAGYKTYDTIDTLKADFELDDKYTSTIVNRVKVALKRRMINAK